MWPFRPRAAIALPDQSLSASDAGRMLAAAAHDRKRAKIRATARAMRIDLGLPPHPHLDG